MEQLHFITKLLDIKDPNIQILDIINKDTHKEIIAKLDYDAPSCPECGNQLKKYDFQKPFCVEKKSHMTYNEKRQNNSLERIIWNNYILSQNY
ncbi:IS1167 transposase [Streptococcus pneumoniae]|nr:IS1167 transposase [Streptococcus pneumoniae]